MTHAPIVQLLMTMQFAQPIEPLNALEIATIYQAFSPAFTEFAQVDAAGPMPHRFEQLFGQEAITPVIATMPRIQMSSPSDGLVCLFQMDRFSFGWQRPGALNVDPGYPGYKALREKGLDALEKFCGLLEGLGRSRPVIWASELAYTDAFRDRNDDGSQRKLSTIYTFLRPPAASYSVRGFEHSWNEEMDRDGILVVKAYGPIVTPNDVTAAFLSTTATFPTPEADRGGLVEALDWAHGHVTTIYERVIEPARREEY